MAGPGLPTNIDTTYADDGTDASVQAHQAAHDSIHGIVNAFDTGVGTATAGQIPTYDGAKYVPVTPPLVSPTLMLYNMKCANIADPAAIPATSGALAQSTTYVFKMYTGTAISFTQAVFWFSNLGAGKDTNWFLAAYDATGTLISGSTSANMSTTIAAAVGAFSFGGTVSVAAGYFYVVLRTGTFTTAPQWLLMPGTNNALLTGTASSTPATAYRQSTTAAAWTGGTAPSSLGTLASAANNTPVAVK